MKEDTVFNSLIYSTNIMGYLSFARYCSRRWGYNNEQETFLHKGNCPLISHEMSYDSKWENYSNDEMGEIIHSKINMF